MWTVQDATRQLIHVIFRRSTDSFAVGRWIKRICFRNSLCWSIFSWCNLKACDCIIYCVSINNFCLKRKFSFVRCGNTISHWCVLIYFTVCALVWVRPTIIHGYLFGNCDFIIPLSENEGTTIVNPGGYLSLLGYIGYYGYYEPGSSCRYFVQAPPNYVVRIRCNIDIAITVSSIVRYACINNAQKKFVLTFSFTNFDCTGMMCAVGIMVQGSINTCATEQFRVSIDGTNDIMNRGMFYCGTGTITITSTNNYCTFGKIDFRL